MQIAVISHSHHAIRQPFIGGLEAHTHQMIAELNRQGHTATMYGKAGSDVDGSFKKIFSGNARNGKNPFYRWGYRRAMHDIAIGSYDLIINNSLNEIPFKMHTLNMPPMLTVFHTPPLRHMTRVLERQDAISNRSYVAVSDFTAEQWQDHCSDMVQTVSNGMNLTDWRIYTEAPKKPIAAWAGRITPEKGTHIAIEACLQANMPLVFGGPIYDRNYFEKRIKPFLDNPLVTYIGHIDRRGVNNLFGKASVALVTPLWDEPFGLVGIEAWASGTPVAALPNGALPSLMRNDVGCLAESDTPEALRIAMQHALSSNRQVCRQYTETNFSLDAMVESYLALVPVADDEFAPDMQWQSVL